MRSAVAHALNGNLTTRPIAPRPCRAHSKQQQHLAAHPQQAQQRRQRAQQQQQQHSLRRRASHLARAERTSSSEGNGTSSTSTSSTITDSEIGFLGKLLVFSFAGAAAIKYGSLVFELPFHPNAAVALTLVLGTPAAYSLFLLTKGEGGKRQQ